MLKNVIFLILGKNQSGKSTFLREKVVQCLSRTVIIDTVDEYSPYDFGHSQAGIDDLLGFGTVVVDTFADFKRAYLENWRYKQFRIICKFKEDDAELILPVVHRAGYTSLVIEEIDLLGTNNLSKKSALFKLFTKNQHCKVNIFGTTQRPAEISKTLTSQSHILISFRQDEKVDLDYFKTHMDNPEELKTLGLGEYRIIKGRAQFNALMKSFNQKKECV
ncbi:MAG: hypothetical protein ACE5IR_11835 [bacterium]